MPITLKRWSDICNDIKVTYAAAQLGEDEETFIHVLHNDEAYMHVAVSQQVGYDEDSDLYVQLIEKPSFRGGDRKMLCVPEYADILDALPSDFDLLVKE